MTSQPDQDRAKHIQAIKSHLGPGPAEGSGEDYDHFEMRWLLGELARMEREAKEIAEICRIAEEQRDAEWTQIRDHGDRIQELEAALRDLWECGCQCDEPELVNYPHTEPCIQARSLLAGQEEGEAK